MISFPNAKINLGLHVICKREDGFHDIETVIYPISMHDSLEILLSENTETTLKVYGAELPGGENICIKAYRLLKEYYDIPAVDMHLLKHIPAGAGLGGGSSDAACTLQILNDIFKLDISPAELEEYASMLGSDCPFFIQNKPVFAYGRGGLFEKVSIDLSGYKIKLVHPEIHVSTMEAYALIQAKSGRLSPNEVLKRPIGEWKDSLVNDFEEPIFRKYPEIKKAKDSMYAAGAIYASMSGSGSTVYGIFES